jgi:ceramide glucosyltransferase
MNVLSILFLIYLVLGAILLLGYLGMTLYCLRYVKQIYPKQIKPAFQQQQQPPVIIFLPCKGASDDFQDNVAKLYNQAYPHLTLITITESADDPASPLLDNMAAVYNNIHHVVAGQATHCCQKNHNLLAGIDFAQSQQIPGEIYIFADADIRPKDDWITRIITPLSDESIFAVSGFRWLTPKAAGFAHQLHAVFNAYLGLIMAFDTYAGIRGGSMAIRKKDFETYAVYEKWSRAMVDDIALSWIIKKHNLRRVFASDVIVYSDSTFASTRQAVTWYVRQTQYGSNYLRGHSFFGLILNTLVMVVVWLMPVWLILGIVQVISWGMIIPALGFYVLAMINFRLLYEFHSGQKRYGWLWMLYTPLFLLLGSYAVWLGFWKREMIWAKIRYRINRRGEVLKINR